MFKYVLIIIQIAFMAQLSHAVEIDNSIHGPDKPTAGSSLFDKMFLKDNGKYDVPYPYDKLQQHIKGFGDYKLKPNQKKALVARLRREIKMNTQKFKVLRIGHSTNIGSLRTDRDDTKKILVNTGRNIDALELNSLVQYNIAIGELYSSILRCAITASNNDFSVNDCKPKDLNTKDYAQKVNAIVKVFYNSEMDDKMSLSFLASLGPNPILIDLRSALSTKDLLESTDQNLKTVIKKARSHTAVSNFSALKKAQTTDEFVKAIVNNQNFLRSPLVRDSSTYFPFGRSLQKPTKPEEEPLLHPRHLITPDFIGGEPLLETYGRVKGRIFCGHYDPTKSIECISYNDQMARYEFQIVEHYDDDEPIKVIYPPRSMCLTCHTNHVPIFAKAPWTESFDTFELAAAKVKAELAKNKTVLAHKPEAPNEVHQALENRFELERINRQSESHQAQLLTGQDSFPILGSAPGRFDRSVLLSGELMRFQKIWKFMCGSGDEGNLCRQNMILLYLQKNIINVFANIARETPVSLDYLVKQSNILNQMQAITSENPLLKEGELKIEQQFITDRDPFIDLNERLKENIDECQLHGRCREDSFDQLMTSMDKLLTSIKRNNIVIDPKKPRSGKLKITELIPQSWDKFLTHYIDFNDIREMSRAIPRTTKKNSFLVLNLNQTENKISKNKLRFTSRSCDETSCKAEGTLIQITKNQKINFLQTYKVEHNGQNYACTEVESSKLYCYNFAIDELYQAIAKVQFNEQAFHREQFLYYVLNELGSDKAGLYQEILDQQNLTSLPYTKKKEDLAKGDNTTAQEKEINTEVPSPLISSQMVNLFEAHCKNCHGIGPSMPSNMPQYLVGNDWETKLKKIKAVAPRIQKQLESRKMPPKPLDAALSDKERMGMINFIKNLGH